jgi:hypothetical protein
VATGGSSKVISEVAVQISFLCKEIAVTKTFLMTTIGAVMVLPIWHFAARAHDHSRPELNSWFESLKSGKGPCCSGADGTGYPMPTGR